MAKDPAVLFYINDWLTSTKEMKADARGWYLNLILHQYDKGSLPNDIEELANLADVRISEYDLFKQVFKQVLEQKFEQNSEGRLVNPKANEILQRRKLFKEKRSLSGKMSYIIRYLSKHYKLKSKETQYIKDNIDLQNIDIKNEQVLKQVFEQILELYRNENENENEDENINKNIPPLSEFLDHAIIACKNANRDFNELKFSIESKYEAWVQDGWKDGNGKKIKNWKSKFNNTLPYLKAIRQPEGEEVFNMDDN